MPDFVFVLIQNQLHLNATTIVCFMMVSQYSDDFV
jgi:hypothetical protein